MTRLTKKDKAELHESSKKWLKENIKEQETIYYCVTKVSQSGMSRNIKFMYHDGKSQKRVRHDPKPAHI